MSSLRKEALLACESALGSLGFAPRGVLYAQDRADGSSGMIGLNERTSDLPHCFEVNPVVGVSFDKFLAVEDALRDDVPRGPRMVLSESLSQLVAPGSGWEFRSGGDSAAVARSLADAVRSHGLPYIAEYSDWRTFSRAVLDTPELTFGHERAKILPIVLALNGDTGLASRMVGAELDRIVDHDDVYAESYRAYAVKFSAMFGAE